MKRKSMTLLLSSLLTVCLVGVGFASWLIVNGDTEEATGQVHVENVDTLDVSITTEWAKDSSDNDINTFKFTAPESSNTSGWLRASDDMETEVMSLALTITIDNPEMLSAFSLAWKAETTTMLADYNNLIVANELPTVTVSGNTKFTTTVNISFSWGEYFDKDGTPDSDLTDNVNPYTFFNQPGKSASGLAGKATFGGDSSSQTWAQEAEAVLEKLYELSGKQLVLVLTTTV